CWRMMTVADPSQTPTAGERIPELPDPMDDSVRPLFREVRTMSTFKRLALTAFGVALLTLLMAAPVQAQRNVVPGNALNTYGLYDPYGTARQAAFNISLYGRAMSNVPPYALGYNPY